MEAEMGLKPLDVGDQIIVLRGVHAGKSGKVIARIDDRDGARLRVKQPDTTTTAVYGIIQHSGEVFEVCPLKCGLAAAE